jgi:hypothetical protein
MIRSLFLGVLCVFLASCGYHVGGKADTMPKGIQTIAVPAFHTGGTRYKLTDQLPQAISREFIQRSRYRIENDPSLADAVLTGSVNNLLIAPTIYDPTSGKATSVQVSVYLTVRLVERTTGRVLYSRPNFEMHQYYQIAIDPHQFFDESAPALDRLSRDVARSVVSGVVENF